MLSTLMISTLLRDAQELPAEVVRLHAAGEALWQQERAHSE